MVFLGPGPHSILLSPLSCERIQRFCRNNLYQLHVIFSFQQILITSLGGQR